MKTVMVIGLGSMGCRRLRLLKKMRLEVRLCGVDTDELRRSKAEETFGLQSYACIEDAMQAESPEAAVISTSPLSHAAIIRECLERGLHVFTELNLVADGYRENIALAEKNNLVLFLSSTFLYREENSYLIDRTRQSDDILNYRYHIGQYLPDWHPWESYTKYFVGNQRTNGCRELFAIELPWLCKAFGPISKVQVLRRKCTDLSTTYPDSFHVLLEHESGHMGSLSIDVVSRKAVRKFEVYGQHLYLTWDGQPDTLREYDYEEKKETVISLSQDAEHQDGYAAFIVENAYENELMAFLAQVEEGIKPPYSFQDDLITLEWIDRIEKAEA